MQSFYVYGGGINAYCVCDFFKKEHIKAIIDRDPLLQGTTIRDIPIISFDTYRGEEKGEKILISAYDAQDAIVADFEKKGVKNYYRSPWMQSEFYKDAVDVIEYHQLKNYKEVLFYQRDPVSECIAEELEREGIKSRYLEVEAEASKDEPIILSTNEKSETVKSIKERYIGNKIIVLNNTKRKESYDYSVLRKFKDIHKGKRCFLVGNGPSVRTEDLDFLYERNEFTFGFNMVFFGYPKMKWRPTYYAMIDQIHMENHLKTLNAMEGIKFFRHLEYAGLNFEGNSYEFHGLPVALSDPKFSFDIEEGIYSGSSVVFDALQIAVYMGFSEIYLIGVDMTMGIDYASKEAHFYTTEEKQKAVGTGNQAATIAAFSKAYKELEPRGIKLRNATRNVWWDEVPRVEFESLFE